MDAAADHCQATDDGESTCRGAEPPCPGTKHGSLWHRQAWQERMSGYGGDEDR